MTATTIDRAAIRVVLLSSLGGALEFFDLIIFGTFAADISRTFFPSADRCSRRSANCSRGTAGR